MSFTVLLMPEAIEALDDTVAYYESLSPSAAENWLRSLEAVIATLESDPGRFPRSTLAKRTGVPLQEAIFGVKGKRPTHRLLFTVADESVRVVTIRHHAQDRWRG